MPAPTIKFERSKTNPLVYCGLRFHAIGYDGSPGDMVREYGIGQHKDGYWGYYSAEILIPTVWKFNTLSDDMQVKITEPYGGKFTNNAHSLVFNDYTVYEWKFQAGGDSEKYIGEEDVQRDIDYVIRAITEYEIEEDYNVIEGQRIGLLNSMRNLKDMLDKGEVNE